MTPDKDAIVLVLITWTVVQCITWMYLGWLSEMHQRTMKRMDVND